MMKLFLNCWFVIGLAVALVISPFVAWGQVSEKGLPESFFLELKHAVLVPVLKLDSVQEQRMLASDKELSIDNRYGVIKEIGIDIKEAGAQTKIPGKGTIWQYKIESEDAYSLGLFFKAYHLPPKAKVFIYNTSRSQLRGAFTNCNNKGEALQLPIAEFPGKDLIIEYFEPFTPEFPGKLVLGAVSQAYTDFKKGVIDRIGINCPEGADWQKEKNSVCLMTFHDGRFSYYCTGALVNNVKQDQTPYFLTANHCVRTEQVANTVVTYFNFENSACHTYDALESQTLSGATFKSGSSYSDFSLLLLKEYPPDEYNPYFAGWDARGNDPSRGVSIHHPNGLPKCISIDSLPIDGYSEKVQWTTDGLRLYSTTLPYTHWAVEFTRGSVELGSSGCPLFDQNNRIVGQLHGGANFVLLFGKFSLSWDHHSSYNQQLAHWLDPDRTTQKTLDGIWKIPPKANFRAQIQQVCPNTPVLFYDQTTQNPIGWLWKIRPSSYSFANGTDSTSQNPQIVFQEEGRYSVSLHTSNKYGTDELTQQNYILSQSKLDVKFVDTGSSKMVCGCDLKAFAVVANGAVSYDFKIDKTGLIDTKSSADTLYLTLNPSAQITQSFDTWVKVEGTNGTCSATDSLLLHINIQPNDHIANAARLHLGRNTGYSNQCATVEKNEPHPWSTGCVAENSWCPNLSGGYNVLNNSVWFTFMGPSNGGLTINTNGFNNQIAVYEATNDALVSKGNKIQYTLLAANDDRSNTDHTALIENLVLVEGKEYLLQVDGNNAAYGDLVINLESHSLEVYPNPSTGLFRLVISNPDAGMAEVTISDLNGKKMFFNPYQVSPDSNQFDIDLSGCAKGIYLINVRMNGYNLNKKLLLW